MTETSLALPCPAIVRLIFPLILLFALVPGFLYGQSGFYWEQPELFSPAQGSFPVSSFNGDLSVVAWQETQPGPVSGGVGDGRINMSMAVKSPGGQWLIRRNLGGPYTYSGSEPAILNALVDPRGRIFLAAAASAAETEILVSGDGGESFRSYRLDSGSESSIAPRIFPLTGGGYIIFIARGKDQTLSIYYSLSQDGYSWAPFQPFVQDAGLQLNFLPSHASFNGVDYVVFQSYVGTVDISPSFQLFLKSSADGGRTWSAARRITTFRDTRIDSSASPDRFNNERPHLSVQNNSLFLVWERRFGGQAPRIYGANIGRDGSVIGLVDQINDAEAYCNNPIAFQYDGNTTVVWFDNRRGSDRAFIAQRRGIEWPNNELTGAVAAVAFARPVVDRDGLNIFWQSRYQGMDRIFSLVPDSTVALPRIRAENFVSGRRTRGDRVRISWDAPYDSSGIYGVAYSWSRTPGQVPPKRFMSYAGVSRVIEQIADEDGTWYFTLIAGDFAGNWSEPVSLTYVRDMTPPGAAVLLPPELDGAGYLSSNTFSMQWELPADTPDLAGYTWSLDYLGSLEPYAAMDADAFKAAAEELADLPAPRPAIMGSDPEASFNNQDNGVWRFTVFPVDEVGNIGPAAAAVFRMNKYVPHTYITYADVVQNEEGVLSIHIIGRGFTDGGRVTRLVLDRDGTAPYDYEYYLDRDFSVLSDREIGDLTIDTIDSGLYRIGVEHPRRGIYMSGPIVRADNMGTIKFGDYSQSWKPSWSIRSSSPYVFDANLLMLLGVLLFCVVGLTASIRGVGNAAAESSAIRVEAIALITGDLMPSEKKKRLTKIKKRGAGLRLKLASFTTVLVLLVVAMVSAPLYYMMTRTREETLLRGLWDRSRVLMEGIASSVRAYLPSESVLELGFLPAQMSSVPEARYVTITGYGSGSAVYDDRVWATNDPDILDKIDTAEYQPGVSRLTDVLTPRLETVSRELGDRARDEAGDLSESITSLIREARSLALRTDAESQQRMNDIQVTTRSFETRLNDRLREIAGEIGSEPVFSTDRLSRRNRTFVFFKPVMYRQGSEDIYFRGLVRLEVSLDSILTEIAGDQLRLLQVILLVALSAIVIGVIGAILLSTVIIRPLRKLMGHVERIRDTEDKSKLEGVDIEIKSQDEIAVLGNTINDMTHGLVKAAQASQDLTIGKEIQKKFIPLDVNREGDKISSGFKDTKNAEFFGYYEGAKGVSGDYFDYLDLDGRYYAIIKCDVAGKGIPAALIMIQVATMFLNHFKQWKPTEKGMHIEEVVYQINDFIETLAFKGRFAAFTLALFDSQTGLIRFCNAGDNIVHWYDASAGKMKTVTLKETPATGVLPNFLVESKGGYTVQTLTIDHGDILFLYTDGIEEAKRKFRDTDFKEILCTEGGALNDTPHANHVVGQGDEEMGPDRVEAIINAVMNQEVYTLHKWHNPEGDNTNLTFDFTGCKGRVEETIMAMVSVEKMFRCFKDPKADEDTRILVDKKVDEFLKAHFLQYRTYCSFTRGNPENDDYMYYTHVNEDAQYDDLTIIGINRK
ncbi:MAG: SpoIIE family protein phosphatase [Treponema sp.]|jgi:serine phosphatase RsbU (regulator of sigma subunit)|nr:SpoIIE family protein phosphatase [Treponema sp.]